MRALIRSTGSSDILVAQNKLTVEYLDAAGVTQTVEIFPDLLRGGRTGPTTISAAYIESKASLSALTLPGNLRSNFTPGQIAVIDAYRRGAIQSVTPSPAARAAFGMGPNDTFVLNGFEVVATRVTR